jgi:hypothetical protein
VVVTVRPIATATATPPNQTIASGNTTSISLSSNVSGTTFSWTVSQRGVTGASGGSGATIAQTLTATGNTSGTATYTITPASLSGCSGRSMTVVVTVTPASVIPPSQFQGKQKKNDFGLQYELYNQLTWTPSSSPGVIGYFIYRDGKKIARVDTPTHSYQDHNRKKGVAYRYDITAFNSVGSESLPIHTVVKPFR